MSTSALDDLEPITIVIADDHEISRLGLKLVLSPFAEFVVIGEVSNGPAALELCKQQEPKVILMDVHMPAGNGIDATKFVKAEFPAIRVLMLTASDRDDEVFAAFAAGADGYCLKQTSGEQLRAAIMSAVQGGCWIDPALAKMVLVAAAGSPQKLTSPSGKPPKFGLSQRELEVLEQLVNGGTNAEIAKSLVVSPETVKTHVRHIMEKLTVSDRTQAAVKALREDLLTGS